MEPVCERPPEREEPFPTVSWPLKPGKFFKRITPRSSKLQFSAEKILAFWEFRVYPRRCNTDIDATVQSLNPAFIFSPRFLFALINSPSSNKHLTLNILSILITEQKLIFSFFSFPFLFCSPLFNNTFWYRHPPPFWVTCSTSHRRSVHWSVRQ